MRASGRRQPHGLEPTLVVVIPDAPSLVREACRHARADGRAELYCVYAAPAGQWHADRERRALEEAGRCALEEGVRLLPVQHVPGDLADAVIHAADECGARVVIMNGLERRSLIARLLGRRMLRRLRRRLGPERSVLFYD